MSLFDWSFLDPLGRTVIAAIETVVSLSAITSLLSLSAALVATWVMQVTTHQAGLSTPSARLALAQRIALAVLAIFLMLNGSRRQGPDRLPPRAYKGPSTPCRGAEARGGQGWLGPAASRRPVPRSRRGRVFGTVVAEIAEISVENGEPKVHRVVCAVDCGIAINPDNVRAQMEGGIGFGLGAVLKSRLTLDKGRIVEGNFDSYEVLRLDEMPTVEVHIVPSEAKPSGVGEPGVPPIGPAVANAFYQATKRRIRALPFKPSQNT